MDRSRVDNKLDIVCNIGSALSNADNGTKALQMGSQRGLSGVGT